MGRISSEYIPTNYIQFICYKKRGTASANRGNVVEEDYTYVINSDDENSDEEDEDNKDLGEDGEEPWEIDDVQSEGFNDLSL